MAEYKCKSKCKNCFKIVETEVSYLPDENCNLIAYIKHNTKKTHKCFDDETIGLLELIAYKKIKE